MKAYRVSVTIPDYLVREMRDHPNFLASMVQELCTGFLSAIREKIVPVLPGEFQIAANGRNREVIRELYIMTPKELDVICGQVRINGYRAAIRDIITMPSLPHEDYVMNDPYGWEQYDLTRDWYPDGTLPERGTDEDSK